MSHSWRRADGNWRCYCLDCTPTKCKDLATRPRGQNTENGRLSPERYLELKGLGARRQGFERGTYAPSQ